LKSYHPDVQTYEVWEVDEEGKDFLRAIFLHDNFSRSNKQGGAWMSEYRSQNRNFTIDSGSAIRTDKNGKETVVPVIVNNNNFCKAPDGQPTLLSFDDAVTLFHEFGHGMHGMLSDVTYQRLAGTSVLRDFVELPSQLFEHWLSQPEVLKKYARHYETDEAIPDELIARLKASQCFNNGFDTVEYLSSALVDQSLHQQVSIPENFHVSTFEKQELNRLSMPEGMIMRHRPTHFLHLFSCSSYASAYYVYLWAEVLDADGFDAFLEKGMFNSVV
jgi:peptidyl-dipeptidase Dcp